MRRPPRSISPDLKPVVLLVHNLIFTADALTELHLSVYDSHHSAEDRRSLSPSIGLESRHHPVRAQFCQVKASHARLDRASPQDVERKFWRWCMKIRSTGAREGTLSGNMHPRPRFSAQRLGCSKRLGDRSPTKTSQNQTLKKPMHVPSEVPDQNQQQRTPQVTTKAHIQNQNSKKNWCRGLSSLD